MPLFAEIDSWNLGGIVGGLVALSGGVVWLAKWIRDGRKGSLDEYKDIVKDQRGQLAQKDDRIRYLEQRGDSLRGIADTALDALEDAAKKKLADEGKPAVVPVAAVIAERRSPVTKEEKEAAELATSRARLVAASLALDLPPREPGVPETDDQRVDRLAMERIAVERDRIVGDAKPLTALKKAVDVVSEKTVELLKKSDEEGR